MFNRFLLASAMFAVAGAAQAEVLIRDSFIENRVPPATTPITPAGSTSLNYSTTPITITVNGAPLTFFQTFANYQVVQGQVDFIGGSNTGIGDFGIKCADGIGGCVDLNGSPGAGVLATARDYGLGGVQQLTYTFQLSGSQRADGNNSFFTAFGFDNAPDIIGFAASSQFGAYTTTVLNGQTLIRFDAVAASDAYETYVIQLTVNSPNGNAFRAYVGTDNGSSAGPIVDDTNLTTASVPEVATWGMLIAGFGLVGATARRRRVTAVAA